MILPFALTLLLISLPWSHVASLSDPVATRPASQEAFLGLSVRDVPSVGCVVTWIDPGPLKGRGLSSPSLERPDLLVTIDGEPASGPVLAQVLATKAPGDTLTLTYRKATTPSTSIPTTVNHHEDVKTLAVELLDRVTWTGTLHTARMGGEDRGSLAPTLLEQTAVSEALAAHPAVNESLERLIQSGIAVSHESPDARRLSRVTGAIERPRSLPEIAEAVARPTTESLRPMRLAATLTAEALDAADPQGEFQGSVPVPGSQGAIYALDFLCRETQLHVREAYGDVYNNAEFARQAIATASGLRDSLMIVGDDAPTKFATIRRGATVDVNRIVAALTHLDAELNVAADIAQAEVEGLPDELKGAVEGDVLTAQEIPDIGWAIVGGAGPNRYDLSKVAAVFDVGGDDTYVLSDLALGMRVVIDRAGNDRYEGNAHQGFAAGICGMFLVDDAAGNDHYSGGAFNAGSGCFGVGVLVDRAGNDTYQGGLWSLGAACWGTGLLIDLGGNDGYRSEYLSQGCGGPRGFGAIVDVAGNDQYDAIGTRPSHYGVADTVASMSQGVGLGIRRAAAGGIGLLADCAGNDQYKAGEFAQGGGYFFGLGVLADHGGNDVYSANRYGQGWAAHQAAGALRDLGGNDVYVGRVAANQGAAWDQSVALLYDAEGNDSYQAESLSQGSAAQQAFAFLVDGKGSDRFIATHENVQGHPGQNEYHFDQPPPMGGVYSFSLFLDLGGEPDVFSTVRPAQGSTALGTPNQERPALSSLHGLFINVGPTS